MSGIVKLTLTSPSLVLNHSTSENQVKIGRSQNCNFVIPKDDLSREHCLFEIIDDKYYISDLESKNGTYIDRKRIPPSTKIEVTEDSLIILSNIYTLKINAFEVKTKADLIFKKNNSSEATTTFQLDLDDGELRSIKEKKILKTKKLHNEAFLNKKSDSIIMITAFIIILSGVILYHALGK